MGRLTKYGEDGWMKLLTQKDEYGNEIIVTIDGALRKLAHYEDLEEQGRLIEVVRCKDCTRCWKDTIYNRLICEGHIVQPNDYCSYAKLKELEGDKE